MTMRWIDEASEYELSTGRRLYANHGILGLGPEDSEATNGYDGDVDGDRASSKNPFTSEERREISDVMIARWMQWALRPVRGSEP